MHKLLLLTLFLVATNLYAQAAAWQTIYPVANCQLVALEYQQQPNKSYQVKLAEKTYTIEDINNLLVLNDQLVKLSDELCPVSNLNFLVVNQVGNDNITCEPDQFFSDDYIQFIRFSADYVNQEKKQCDNMIPYIKLQEEISALNNEELVKFKPSKKLGHVLLKVLTDKETDQMIDQFNACGGKKGSDKFVTNMILLEAKKSCVVPQMLSWEEAETIAKSIGDEHKNTNLLMLNKNIRKLTRDATMGFTNKVLEKEVSSLLGPYIPDTKKFIKELDSYKRLEKQQGSDDLTDYISNVFSTDATLEIAQKAIPIFIKESFASKLPVSWEPKRKDDYLNNVLIKGANDDYLKCMGDRIKNAKYGENLKEKDLLSYRTQRKNDYCGKFPKQCDDDCDGGVNFLEMTDTASDTDIITGCVLQSITKSINPLLRGIIYDQKEEFKDNFTLTDEMADTFSNKTWDNIIQCANRKIKRNLNWPGEVNILNDEKPLQKIKTSDFENILVDCSDIAEARVSGEFVKQLLLHEPTIQQTFNSGPLVNNFDSEFPKATVDVVDQIVRRSFNKCMEIQYRNFKPGSKIEHGIDQKNAMLCTPIVEMNASLLVVGEELKNTAKENGLENDPAILKVLADYEACGDRALKQSLKDLGSLTSSTPINNVEDSKNYLDKNPALFNCVNTAIGDIGHVVAGNEFDKIIFDQKGKVKDIKFLEKQKPVVQQTIKSCLQEGLNNLSYYGYKEIDESGEKTKKYIAASSDQLAQNKLKNDGIQFENLNPSGKWTNFIQFNNQNGLTQLQRDCEIKANQAVMPKLIINEAKIELKPLINDGFLKNETEVNQVLVDTAHELAREMKITIPKSIKPSEMPDFVYQEALGLHLKNGGTSDQFIDLLSNKIENHTLKKVHNNLMGAIQNKTSNINQRAKFGSFAEYFPTSCLQEMYNRFMKNTPSSGESMKLDELASYLQQGLAYTEEKDPAKFWDELKVIQAECKNFSKFKTEKDFHKSKFYEIILKGEIYKQFSNEFEAEIMANINQMEKNLTNPNLAIKKQYIDYLRKNMKDLFAQKMNPLYFESAVFKDGELLKFAQNNLDGLLKSDTKVKNQLTEMLLSKFFADTSKDSFASQFTKHQIIASMGISGVDDAVSSANYKGTWIKLGSWRIGPNNYAMQSTREIFNDPNNIAKALDWDNLSNTQRSKYINTITYTSVIGASYVKEHGPKAKDNLLTMYEGQYLQKNPVPQDTNPIPFQQMAKNNAHMQYNLQMMSMRTELEEYVKKHGHTNFNQQIEKIVAFRVAQMGLPDKIEETKYPVYGAVVKPLKSQTQNMLENELRDYYLTHTIASGLEDYKYSDGKSAVGRIEDRISQKTKGKIGGDVIRYTTPIVSPAYVPLIIK
jgi:DNA-binding XRE family transcriptional regulator